jgi:hypothetical protein
MLTTKLDDSLLGSTNSTLVRLADNQTTNALITCTLGRDLILLVRLGMDSGVISPLGSPKRTGIRRDAI